MTTFLILLIRVISQVLFWVIVAEVILSYFMSPYHPIRAALLKITDPLLAPIRRIVKPVGTLDFSPLILIILIQVIANLLIGLLSGLG